MAVLDKEIPLRRDLAALRQYLQQETGAEELGDSLKRANIKRVMEVGTGIEFEAIGQLAALRNEQEEAFFNPENLRAVDPNLADWSESRLKDSRSIGPLLPLFTRQTVAVEFVARDVESGNIPPFDVVFSHGVVSYGGLLGTGIGRSREESLSRGKSAIIGMRKCLNPDNQEALLLLSAKAKNSVLPFSQREFKEMDLQFVHGIPAEEIEDSNALSWRLCCKVRGTLSDDEPLFNLVICRRK